MSTSVKSQNNRLFALNAGWTPTWLIRDEFTDTRAAGSVNGTAATPGPGTRTVTDTGSALSVGGGYLSASGGAGAFGNPGVWYGGQSLVVGVSVFSRLQHLSGGAGPIAGFDANTTGDVNGHVAYIAGTGVDLFTREAANIDLETTVSGTWYTFAVVMQSAGSLIFVRGGVFTDWTLVWRSGVASPATVYPTIQTFNAAYNADYLRVIQLPAPFDTDDGLATDTHSGSVAAGTTFTHESDFVLEFTVDTLPSTATGIRVMVRKQGTNDYWLVYVNQTGGFHLYEYPSGTSRASAAGVISPGDRIVVIAEGTTIKGYSANTLRWSYASATAFATSTNGSLEALTGGAVSNLKTWPRTLSGTAASILNKAGA